VKKAGSGLGARMAVAPAPSAVAAGFAAATGADLPEVVVEPEVPAKAETVALNIRLPKDLHRTLRRIAFDEETSINALLIAGAEAMLAARKA
jgi:predicted HicB family RNase H-like nuclease